MSEEQAKPIHAEREQYFWRLVDKAIAPPHLRGQRLIWLEHCRIDGAGKERWWVTEAFLLDRIVTHTIQLFNALLAFNALDYSALSKETCEALRGLGVKIPVQCDYCSGTGVMREGVGARAMRCSECEGKGVRILRNGESITMPPEEATHEPD